MVSWAVRPLSERTRGGPPLSEVYATVGERMQQRNAVLTIACDPHTDSPDAQKTCLAAVQHFCRTMRFPASGRPKKPEESLLALLFRQLYDGENIMEAGFREWKASDIASADAEALEQASAFLNWLDTAKEAS